MQYSTLALALLAGSAIASPIQKRTAAQIESDVAAIITVLGTFDTDIKAFDGSLTSALTLLTVSSTLETDVTTATTAITSTGTLSATDSAAVATSFTNLTNEVLLVLADTTAKEATVAAAGYATYVASSLSTIKTNTDALYTALEKTINSAYTAEIVSLLAKVDAAFATTLAAY